MTSNQPDRLDRIEALLETTAQRIDTISQQQQINIRAIELLGQRVDSNAKAIETLTSDIAANRADIIATRASVDGLVQTIAEFSIRTEVRLNKLDEAIADIRTTNQNLERILERLTYREGN